MSYRIKHCLWFFFAMVLQQNLCAQKVFPYKLNKSDYYLVSIGLASNTLAFGIENSRKKTQISDFKWDASQIHPFDKGAISHWNSELDKFSDVFVVGFMATPLLFNGPLFKQKLSANALVFNTMYIEMLGVTLGLAELTKTLSTRNRPYLYGDKITDQEKLNLYNSGDARQSFFSLHTAFAFGSAAFISKYSYDIYGKSLLTKALCVGSFSLATGIGLSRYYSGQHFPTDIITGAFVGSIVGILVPSLHKQTEKQVSIHMSTHTLQLVYCW